MNQIKYLVTKLRLCLAAYRATSAKNQMMSAIKASRNATGNMNRRYRHFLSLSKKQEKLAVSLKRIQRKNTKRPIVKVKIPTGKITILPKARANLTDFDIEMALTRHQNGDWGDLPAVDWWYNNEIAKYGLGKIISRYRYQNEKFFFIETDTEKKNTFICLEVEKI